MHADRAVVSSHVEEAEMRSAGQAWAANRRRAHIEPGAQLLGTAAGLGHNGGPPIDPRPVDEGAAWRLFCWTKASKRAWKNPPREVMMRRLTRAAELGMTYREYTLEILERGRCL